MNTRLVQKQLFANTRASGLIGLVAVLLLLSGCNAVRVSPPASTYDTEVPAAWFSLALTLVRETPGFSPPVASRAFGYLGVTLYETVRPGILDANSLAGQLNELEALLQPAPFAHYHWPLAANRAQAQITRGLFPTASAEHLAAIDALEAHFNHAFQDEVDAVTFARSVAWGETIADAIFTWSTTDGGHQGYLSNFPAGYQPPSGPGHWISTPPAYSAALQPYWGHNRPFALASGDACSADPPPVYAEQPGSQLYIEAREVYEMGQNRTPEQLEIARFWADDPGRTATPPGHWVAILTQILNDGSYDLGLAAEAYARLGIAVADSFITCWATKYQYNLLRPITYIQQVIDADWNATAITDPVTTPPFPEYTSGHSVQSAAAAAVLTSLFGADFAFVDRTHEALGYAPRAFPSFEAAAQEAAISRLYGGIHYRVAIDNGLDQGYCVATRALALRLRE
jgi:hypothetical protein